MQLRFAIIASILLVPALAAIAQTKASRPVTRAQPPKFEKSSGPFYADAFAEGLVGERPADLSKAGASTNGTPMAPGSAAPAGSGSGGVAGSGWAALVSATTIEDGIKGLKLQLDQSVTTPSDFAGKGYKLARRDLTMLAMLFGIAGEYEGDVRWKESAPAARDVFARTAANAKVGTQQVWQEAKLRKEELADLLNGNKPYGDKAAESKAAWGQVANRAPLMQHLELAWEPRLKAHLADQGAFGANADKVLHDAETFAAIGQVLAQSGMADADDEEYQKFCHQLRDGAKAIADAVKTKNFEQAAAGSTEITKACAGCHENYRG